MGREKVLISLIAFAAICSAGAAAVALADGETISFAGRAAIVAALIALLVVFAALSKLLTSAGALADRYGNLQRLLIDIRDGKKNFFIEKRGSVRLSGEVRAKFVSGAATEEVCVVDVGVGGALIRTKRELKAGQIIRLEIFLPLFPQPVNVGARVVHLAAISDTGGPLCEAGLEFVAAREADMDKIAETVRVLAGEGLRGARGGAAA